MRAMKARGFKNRRTDIIATKAQESPIGGTTQPVAFFSWSEKMRGMVKICEANAQSGFRLVSIYGDQKIIKGRLKIMNLVNHKIVFEAID